MFVVKYIYIVENISENISDFLKECNLDFKSKEKGFEKVALKRGHDCEMIIFILKVLASFWEDLPVL